jgi:hypothetical protein
MAFPSGSELVELDRAGLGLDLLDAWKLVEFGRLPGSAGQTVLDDLPLPA